MSTSTTVRVWLARHGETEANRGGLYCGHSETKLTVRGEAQAAALGRRLAAVKVTGVATSDLGRAVATAGIALAGKGLAPYVDPDLRELHYGQWEMKKDAEIRRDDPAQHKLMRDEDPAWQPPGGEDLGQVRTRMADAFRRLVSRTPSGDVLVVSHGTALSCLFAELLGMPTDHALRMAPANCGLSRLDVAGGRVYLALFNDVSHLDGI